MLTVSKNYILEVIQFTHYQFYLVIIEIAISFKKSLFLLKKR